MSRLSLLALGLFAGLALAIAALNLLPDRLPHWAGGRPPVLSVAGTTLNAIQRQPRLTIMTARLTGTVTSRQERFGGLLSASKTLIIPGTIRYEIDLTALDARTMRWDRAANTLTIFAPRPLVAGPEVDLTAMQEYRDGRLLLSLTSAEAALDAANRAALIADMRAEAASEAMAELADTAARDAIRRLFLMPLIAAGHEEVQVKVTFVAPPPISAATSN
jgi:hypothetical protein